MVINPLKILLNVTLIELGEGVDAAPSGFLNAAPKRLKQLNLNLLTFPDCVLVKCRNSNIGNRGFLVAMATLLSRVVHW